MFFPNFSPRRVGKVYESCLSSPPRSYVLSCFIALLNEAVSFFEFFEIRMGRKDDRFHVWRNCNSSLLHLLKKGWDIGKLQIIPDEHMFFACFWMISIPWWELEVANRDSFCFGSIDKVQNVLITVSRELSIDHSGSQIPQGRYRMKSWFTSQISVSPDYIWHFRPINDKIINIPTIRTEKAISLIIADSIIAHIKAALVWVMIV